MRCTECNKVIRPVVAVDIDGTMGNYHRHFLDFASNYLNRKPYYHYVGNQPFKEWFCMTYQCTPDDWHDIKLAYRQGGLKRTMPAYLNVAELCIGIRKAGAELWVTTTRPYIRHDNIDPDTREWLRRHHIQYDYLIYDGHKYDKLQQLVGKDRVCAVLDDLRDEIVEASQIFGSNVPILRLNNFNTAFKDVANMMAVPVVMNLPMAGRLIDDRIKEWRKQNDGADGLRRDDRGDSPRPGDTVSL